MLNALTATVLKCTSPGVPDFYQGNELPEFVLVDPDNRHAVDFKAHATLLQQLWQRLAETSCAEVSSELLTTWHDGRVKLWITWRLLEMRRQLPELFAQGSYRPMPVTGTRARLSTSAPSGACPMIR